ncbi:oxidoreductase domain protein [Emticicia oligotrophica DSM 17448]|uniref:Oxidoreductase domain protein n=1 Tax=Emticicia oligotrophica (strain DSM 17448 / CIP 109782 / MTCC 6937 / GPTSA100-15) TaxID=929562 RepID=A0ABM5N1M9_EMTOG|nr:Gfo/Idh/MocA family oxidoreductase [Emticicia oligotrophica]AFK03365.1 oxidoreductase domain protein [Emticicia oligotrophica DSM 17448]
MKNDNSNSRRKFLQQIGATSLVAASSPLTSFANQAKAEERILQYEKKITANDKIRIGVIGYGVQGHFDLRTALKVPGVELAGICDLYNGRLENAKEQFGNELFTTNNYKDILDKKDIDAVLICTHDVWHARIALDALAKGKHVYCEKPMVYKISEGYPVMAAAKKSGKVFQVGSQRVSSIGYAKAKELLAAGEIGKLNMVNAVYDRQSSIGAWEYTIPKDADAMTTNWGKFIEATEKMAFDAKKFFWWRAFKEVGTGVAGDLFIHLLSGSHFMTNSKGPETIYSTGQFSYWKDGRNLPDVMSGVMQYPDSPEHPAFQMTLQVNFISGTGGQEIIQLVGSEGVIRVQGNNISIKHSLMPEAPGFGGYDSVFTFSKSMQDEMTAEYNAKWTTEQRKRKTKEDIIFKAPDGYDDHLDHFTNFFDAIRTGKQVVEDAEFGFRAAAPALSCNESYLSKKIIKWDPVNLKLKA